MAENETAVNRPAENENLKEWTVMFFFAGDNSLSPFIVSQLKAIKDAGFHPDVDVLAHFDSNEVGVPTKFLNVNRNRKKERKAESPSRPFMIGDNGDPFIRDMEDDTIKADEIDPKAGRVSASVQDTIGSADSVNALGALKNFVGFCSENHKAKNYILFLVGHGLIVGHDSFLPDDNPVSAVTLADLRATLVHFNEQITKDGGTLQLLALHSCSMSAIEVAYELRGQAKYMMASEGISYIGSWPYRQLLMKLFRNVVMTKGGDPDAGSSVAERPGKRATADTLDELIKHIYDLSFLNAKDYAYCGYSLDLSLCSLERENYQPLTDAIGGLVHKMIDALDDETPRGQIIKEIILLAHWESQSYWNESYTDLFDFCKCLDKRCHSLLDMLDKYTDGAKTGEMYDGLGGLSKSCSDVMDVLSVERPRELAERFGPVVIGSRYFGPLYQYSHGLSVYFPWSKPLDDGPQPHVCVSGKGSEQAKEVRAEQVMKSYENYCFNAEMKASMKESWADFLNSYFKETQRKTRRKEDSASGEIEDNASGEKDTPLPGSGSFNPFGMFAGNPMAALTKGAPSTGADCTCASIKNYPTEDFPVAGKTKSRLVRAF